MKIKNVLRVFVTSLLLAGAALSSAMIMSGCDVDVDEDVRVPPTHYQASS